jgi:PAS domain S-box-containing protein
MHRTDEAAAQMAQGEERASGVGAAGLTTEDRRFTYRRVAGFSVYALAARPSRVIVADWLRAMVPQLVIGVPAWLGLIALAWLVRRSQSELEARVESRTAALREGEQRLRLAHEAAGIGYWERDMKTGETQWSPEMYALFGLDPVRDGPMGHGRYFSELVHPDDRDRVQAAAREALETGRYHCEYRVSRPRPDGGREQRWIMGRGVMADGKGGHVLLGANVDITERREAEEQEALLMQEVDHRAKNVLAVVLSMLRLTPREDPAAFARAVEGRVLAMSRVHTLLAERHWNFADLWEIVEAELRAYASPESDRSEPRISMSGPRVRLAPTVAQSISVIVHELATNAAKYGALSIPAGRVEVSWTVSDDVVRFVWAERGGPLVAAPPVRRGFGTRLIEATLRHQLGGEVSYDWAPSGLTATLTVQTGLGVGGVAASAAD